MEEHQEFQMKETNNTITQKTDLGYDSWILPYPKKKENHIVEVELEETIKFHRSGVIDKVSIEEQKIILLAPTLIEYDEANY
jgi:hypothetical protein